MNKEEKNKKLKELKKFREFLKKPIEKIFLEDLKLFLKQYNFFGKQPNGKEIQQQYIDDINKNVFKFGDLFLKIHYMDKELLLRMEMIKETIKEIEGLKKQIEEDKTYSIGEFERLNNDNKFLSDKLNEIQNKEIYMGFSDYSRIIDIRKQKRK